MEKLEICREIYRAIPMHPETRLCSDAKHQITEYYTNLVYCVMVNSLVNEKYGQNRQSFITLSKTENAATVSNVCAIYVYSYNCFCTWLALNQFNTQMTTKSNGQQCEL